MNYFALETDEALLLLEYEKSNSIAQVANNFKRDPSVISRSLKKLSEKLPVLEKVNGKSVITELGKKFNHWTAQALQAQNSILNERVVIKIASTREFANRYLINEISKLFPSEKYHVHLLTFESNSEKLLLNGLADIVFDCGKPYDPQIAFKRPVDENMSFIVSKNFVKKFNIKKTRLNDFSVKQNNSCEVLN